MKSGAFHVEQRRTNTEGRDRVAGGQRKQVSACNLVLFGVEHFNVRLPQKLMSLVGGKLAEGASDERFKAPVGLRHDHLRRVSAYKLKLLFVKMGEELPHRDSHADGILVFVFS